MAHLHTPSVMRGFETQEVPSYATSSELGSYLTPLWSQDAGKCDFKFPFTHVQLKACLGSYSLATTTELRGYRSMKKCTSCYITSLICLRCKKFLGEALNGWRLLCCLDARLTGFDEATITLKRKWLSGAMARYAYMAHSLMRAIKKKGTRKPTSWS